jgi:hypothetical protein
MSGDRQPLERGLGAGVDSASDVARAIAGWRPGAVGEQAAGFAREVPSSPARARALLFAAARLAAFGASVGLEPRAEVLLHPSVIERFVVCEQRAVSPATRRTLRSNLRSLARALGAQPRPVALPRERAKRPYSDAQIAAYLALAAVLSTPARRMREIGRASCRERV